MSAVRPDDEAEEERRWAAEKRDFVADRRDEIADARDAEANQRDAEADERERLSDERESEHDEWERQIDSRREELGQAAEHLREERAEAAARQADAASQRRQFRSQREQGASARHAASSARTEAAKQREAANPTTGLAAAFAEIAQQLYQASDFDDVLTRIVETAVETVTGCDMASITVRTDGTFSTAASTHPTAVVADEIQYEAREGPCLDAVDEAIVHTPSLPDERWPTLSARPVEAGVGAVVSYSISTEDVHTDGGLAGSLNLYSGTPHAFDDDAREIGLILAAHASVAVGAVRHRSDLEQLGRQLHDALSSRDVIGQAKGILMERMRITPEEAFDVLRRASQRLNVKLREVAERLAETGELG